MTTRILYIDDQADEAGKAERVKERFSRAEEIQCDLISPPDNVTGIKTQLVGEVTVADNPPDLFLVDQDLITVNYYGSTLVAEIRSQFPEHPIVIITRRSVLRNLGTEKSRQLVEEIQTFDDLILKDVVEDKPVDMQQRLIALSEGFRILREIENKNWGHLVEALKADEEEEDLLREAAPPLPKPSAIYSDEHKTGWTVTGAAHWVKNVIIEYPGILYDSLHAATRLGISEESFKNEVVQRELEGSRYDGIFAPFEGRWWKRRLLGIAQEFIAEQNLNGPINQNFAQAFNLKYQISLEPSRCVWDGMPLADQICFVLQAPVKTEHSFRYYPDNRPGVMDPARVSFRAIQESEGFDEDLIDSSGRKLLSKIQDLPDPRQRVA
jgi:hypothetical protein